MNKSKVVIIRSKKVLGSNNKVNSSELVLMLKKGLVSLTGDPDFRDVVSRFYTPQDVIGMKVNCLAGKGASTHPELAISFASLLKEAGIKEKNIIIWDRANAELEEMGFPLNYSRNGIRCFGTDTDTVGYSRDLYQYLNIGSLLSRIPLYYTSVQVNLPMLKDHSLAGITCSLKNFYGAVNNPNKYHEDGCNPFVADLNALPQIKDQNRLIICDALTVQYRGGPSYLPYWNDGYGGIIISTDPAALDFTGYQVINQLRRKNGSPTLEKSGIFPKYILTAADRNHNLGKASSDEIEIIKVSL
ncbi:MAG: DUF362 domain-containing protein [candidate division Zixibacteria bacterium]|nr:DUF362 domain-containing protein [candidate division Zixibacteria bacterium]